MNTNFKIIENNTVSVHDGADELYHIIPSGFEDQYIVVNGGPHFNGEIEIMKESDLFKKFNLVIHNGKPIS